MKGRKIKYSAEELAWIEAHSTDVRAKMCATFNSKFGRDISLQNINALCKRNGWMTGRTGCFKKGDEPHNKGKYFPVAANHPNCLKTHFKVGNEPHNTNHLGHERLSKDGYVEVSVAETNPQTGYERRYVHKHRYEWEKANGPISGGYVLKCLNGDKADCDPSNWEPVKRSVLARLNGGRFKKRLTYDDAPPELKPIVMNAAKLKDRIAETTTQSVEA